MSDTIPQSISNGCRKYVKSRIIINTFNTFNNVELKDYTTDELREELKRRAKEARLNAKRSEPEYKEFTGVIKHIDQWHRGIYSYLFDITSAVVNGARTNDYIYNSEFKLKQGLFQKKHYSASW